MDSFCSVNTRNIPNQWFFAHPFHLTFWSFLREIDEFPVLSGLRNVERLVTPGA